MKKNLWFLAAVLCMAAYLQNEEIIAEQPTTGGDSKSPDEQVVIRLDGGELNASVSTTVIHTPITDANFIGTSVGVFTLTVSNNTDVAATDWSTAAGALLDNIQRVIVTQASSPGSEANTKKISLYRGGTSGAVYCYPVDNKYDYTFYEYSSYQATSAAVTASQTTMRFTFNGSQSIMWNKAAAPNIPEQSTFIDEGIDEKNSSVLTGYEAKHIRQLKYHHDLVTTGGKNGDDYKWMPNINSARLPARFTFQVIAAKKQSEADKEAVQKLKVKSVRIGNHGAGATPNVIDGTLTQAGGESLSMLSIGTDNVATGTFTPSTAENSGDKIGYLMVKSTDGTAAFEPKVTMEAPDATTSVPIRRAVTLQVNTPGGFKQGIIYSVQIGVYLMQEVMVGATLAEWQDFNGGNVDAPTE